MIKPLCLIFVMSVCTANAQVKDENWADLPEVKNAYFCDGVMVALRNLRFDGTPATDSHAAEKAARRRHLEIVMTHDVSLSFDDAALLLGLTLEGKDQALSLHKAGTVDGNMAPINGLIARCMN